MFRVLILAAAVAAVLGGRSPHADYIEQTYAGNPDIHKDIIEDAMLDVPGLVTKYGYPVESHEVVTEDNYILTMHRIPHGRYNNNQPSTDKPVVFLMHGLLSSSADYLVLGPPNALAYFLTEEGYDVWMGNARGNFYSRRHRTLDPDSSNGNFWRFSWDEIGNLDLKAFVDYILNLTGQSRLHYIGHSQGGTAFLVLNSLRPEYNEKFISFQGLAPASFFINNEHPVFTNLAPMESFLETMAFAIGRSEVFGSREFIEWFTDTLCNGASSFQGLCDSVELSGRSDYYNETIVPLILGHAPAGASIRQFTHFGQGIRFKTFRRFNYNALQNLAVYGNRNPPEYNLNRVTVPAYLHYSTRDTLVHPKDVELLATRLPNVQGAYLIPSETFDHLDFIWGNGVRARLYEKVVGLMRQAEQF